MRWDLFNYIARRAEISPREVGSCTTAVCLDSINAILASFQSETGWDARTERPILWASSLLNQCFQPIPKFLGLDRTGRMLY